MLVVLTVLMISAMVTVSDTSSDVMPGVTVTMGPEGLKGEKRVLADGLATQEECDMLLDLFQVGANAYFQGIHIFSDFEAVHGMEANEAAQLAQQGVVPVDSADKFLTLSEKARQFTHAYFGLEQELYIQFTHLVCRTAEPYSTDDRKDLSHKIHADSCELNFTDWTCKPYPPHSGPLHKRDYSSILFLNDEFKGGKFFFSDRNLTAEATVQPRCGRLVAFSSGPENPHGVQAVLQGRRCALAMWYTLDKQHDERIRHEARTIVDSLRESAELQEQEDQKKEL
ncbi:PREDICTED: prolyl 3-hydroxylase 3-like [Branchiostoma belcheri]|uniref:procollagen-proline 3-dioxygenase n=1 Tax=Branchiostoma belcheri TaxID=7741 RepID=A0A6P5AY35_BRABE|nr:PREDICTED: prolyl 3-hydroxylase 3-like [Branchiostoma belcheri]